MEPSSAAASARFRLVSVASFGLITGACVFIGYYIVRRYRRSSDLNSTGLLPRSSPNEKQDTGEESKNAEVVSDEAAKEEEHEARVNSCRDLRPENRDFDTKNQDSVTESEAPDVNRSTSPGKKRKVSSADVTHFPDETNGDLQLSSDFNEGAPQQSQKQDTCSEAVVVGGGKESGSPLCQSQVNGLNAHGTEEAIEATEPQKPKADVRVTVTSPHEEALNRKAQFLHSNDGNLGTSDRQNDKSKISEEENFSRDQSAKSGKSLKIGGDTAAASTQESKPQDLNKEHVDSHQQLAVASTAKSSLPLPLTPPPDVGSSRRQRGGRGAGQTAAVASRQTRGAGGSQSARSNGRRRWSPLDENTAAAENVELDAGSQQVSWTSNRTSGGGPAAQSGACSPWTVGAPVTDDAVAGGTAGKVGLFDDNFVVDAVAKKKGSGGEVLPFARSHEQPGADGRAKDIGALVQAAPDCVLERKPLISEEEEEEDEEDDDNDGHLFADHQSNKRTEEEGERRENVAAVHEELSTSTAEEGKKLVHIDENCVDSLIQLLANEGSGASDPAVQLASLRALVSLSWTTEKHADYRPIVDRLFATVDGQDAPPLRIEALRVLANLAKNPDMVSYLLAAKAPGCLLKMLTPDADEDLLTLWLGFLDDVLWTSKELCLTYASLPSERRAASPETVYTGLYGLKNSRLLKSRIFILSRHRSQRVTYLASHIYSCLTS